MNEKKPLNCQGKGERVSPFRKNLTLIYWKGKRYWLGKLVENPEIMSQGRTHWSVIDQWTG